MSSSSEDEDDGKKREKQPKQADSSDKGTRAMFNFVRNSANSTKNREMYASMSQVLEVAAYKNQKGMNVDMSHSTDMDRKGSRFSMLSVTSATFYKGCMLTWQVMALQGESAKHVVAIAKKIVAYTKAALKYARKQSRLDPSDVDEHCKPRRGDASLQTVVASLAAIAGETTTRANQIFTTILRMVRGTVEVPISLDARAAELRLMNPHKYDNLMHWSESVTRFLEITSSEILQSAQRGRRSVEGAVSDLVSGLTGPYCALVKGGGSLLHPLRQEAGDLIGGESAYASEKSLQKSNQMLNSVPGLRKAIEDDSHSGADLRLGDQGRNWVMGINVTYPNNLTFMRHMGMTERSASGHDGGIFQELLAIGDPTRPRSQHRSTRRSTRRFSLVSPGLNRTRWVDATSVKQPRDGAAAGETAAGNQGTAAGMSKNAGSKRILDYDNSARPPLGEGEGQDLGYTPGRWPKQDDDDRGTVDPNTPSTYLAYGYADAKWGAEYKADSKSNTYAE